MSTIDNLLFARAELKIAADAVKALENELKDSGEFEFDGEFAHGKLSVFDVDRVDWKAVAAKLDPSRQLVQAHTKTSVTKRLTITAHLKAAA